MALADWQPGIGNGGAPVNSTGIGKPRMMAAENPKVELFKLHYKEFQDDRFRRLTGLALRSGLLSEVVSGIADSRLYRLAIGPISIELIVRRRDRPQERFARSVLNRRK